MARADNRPGGLLSRIVEIFLTSQLSMILLVLAMCVGVASVLVTPREEEPQIVVPLADVYIQAPGASAKEVEKLVAAPLEQLLWQIDGVEYVYSMSRQDMAVVTVRFYVGEDRENSLVKLHNKISMNIDDVPPIVRGWVIKPVEIDDVPIVTLTLYSARYDDHELHRIGQEVLSRLGKVPDISRTAIVGGRKREVRVELQPERLAGRGLSPLQVVQALKGADASVTAGSVSLSNREFSITSDSFLASEGEVADLVVGVDDGRPTYLRDVARIIDGPVEPTHYTRIGFSNAWRERNGKAAEPFSYPAVTLALAKKKGTNAVTVARQVLREMKHLQETVIPSDVRVEVSRNYGRTAQQKVNELLGSLGFAVATVVILLAVFLGWREAVVVALAVPISFSLALFCNYLFGYTINRVTLFALILSLGLVVDDPITNVDNIQRHILQGRRKPVAATLFAVDEVLPPVIMSTLAIIVTFTPLFFITGMMGPYMAPMAANVPMTVTFSTVCALSIVPWLTYLMLRNKSGSGAGADAGSQDTRTPPKAVDRIYRFVVSPFLDSRLRRWALVAFILVLMGAAAALALLRMVPLKMLPFDNKNEFQIVLDMPEGTPLEATDRVLRHFEDYLRGVPEVTSFVTYTGTASPMDFNGMVRHYYLRTGPHLADIRVELVDKDRREQQSHEIVLRLRKDLERIAREQGAVMQLVELPPGPPVLSTLVAEIYGNPDRSYEQLIRAAQQVRGVMETEPFVVDTDVMTEADHDRFNFVIDKEKAALHGVSTDAVIQTLRLSVDGVSPATVHVPDERAPLQVRVVLPRDKRSHMTSLSQVPVATATGAVVELAELVDIQRVPAERTIYHKNLQRVVYVLGEMAGRAPAEAILDMQKRIGEHPLPRGTRADWAGEGEWKITLRVFRDMGIAFAAALVGIYILLIVQTGSFFLPVLIMMAIPLTLIGVMPGFWLLNLLTGPPVGGFDNPVFFTATGMIGMIALGGIVIRNSLILIEFIQDALRNGTLLREAILESGAIRMRPILLTAATTALGAWPITLDPIFSGLAWTLIFGLFASTLFTLVVVPVTYFALYRKRP
ncbi:MAG: efflux RND transporter permease subunit [Desulfobacteraceae bacterium]|nr:efflux RND transporter permease subunit [Desulfobacteraceae bacterium]